MFGVEYNESETEGGPVLNGNGVFAGRPVRTATPLGITC